MIRLSTLLLFAGALAARASAPLSIEIDLGAQKAFLLHEGQVIYETPISSGRPGFATPTGNFTITEKDANHRSTLYGKIVDSGGRTLVRDADSDMPVPRGARFVQAPMKHFLRFDGATGLHAGHLPGYPASHGCVRMPEAKAALFFQIVELGTPVRVHGKPPQTTPARRKVAVAAPPKSTPAPAATPAPRKWFKFIRRVE